MDSCEEAEQCIDAGETCRGGHCQCDDEHKPYVDGQVTICRKRIFYGDSCKEHNDCAFYMGETAMVCEQSKCVCRQGYELYNAESKLCVKSEDLSSSSGVVANFFARSLVSLIFVLIIL